MTRYSLGLYLLGLLVLTDVSVSQLRRSSKSSGSVSSGASSSGGGSSASQIVDFDCPEEFGYYPHPGDCTQYYVCVFGGALLESCTGGLMYSHELQTCDWPRNVGCGEAVSAVSTAKAVEPRPRQPIQLRPQHQPQQLQAQQQQQQQQQYVQQRPLQRDEAIPKHHLYAEEDLGPAEEVESDRQQRVYRGQPATLGQVARDRDGLSRHSNALQVSPANGREKLSVISFGTQQQYSRQTIQPAAVPYVEPTTTQRVTSRGYNTTQHQQYTPSPYDPYYNIYEDDTDLYKDIDYSQYTGQQYQAPAPAYKDKQSQVPQQQVQTTPSRKPSIQYSPPPPAPQPQQSYNTVQQDVFSQAVAQDYNDNYNLQDEDVDYKQSDLDLKSNRSGPLQPQKVPVPTPEGEKVGGTENHQNTSLNRQLTLTAAFSFDDEKTPVTSSKRFEENARQRGSVSSFRVEEPPSSGPLRETHEMVLSYIRQENEKDRFFNRQENKTKMENKMKIKQSPQKEILPKNNPKPFDHHPDNNKENQLYSTIPPTQDTPVLRNIESKLRSGRPFRIVVPSTTENVDSDQVTFRPRLTTRRGYKVQIETSETNDPSRDTTVRPYKLPTLSRESLSTGTAQEASSLIEPTRSKMIQGHLSEKQTSSTQVQTEKVYLDSSDAGTKTEQTFDAEIIKFIPILPQKSFSRNNQQEKFEADKAKGADQVSDPRVVQDDKLIRSKEYPLFHKSVSSDLSPVTRGGDVVRQRIATAPQVEESTLNDPSLATRGRDVARQRIATAPQEEESTLNDPSLSTRVRDVARQRIATAPQVEESALNDPSLATRGRDVARQRIATAPQEEESTLNDPSLSTRGRDVVRQRIATAPQVEESTLTDPSLATRGRDVARQRIVTAPQVEESTLNDLSLATRGRDVARQRIATAPQVEESTLNDPSLATRGRDVARQRIATAPQVEESTLTDPSLATRGRDVARQRIVTQLTSTSPPGEESIFKFISINAVRNRLPNQENNKNIFPNDEKSDSIIYQRKVKENIAEDKYQAILSQNKEHNPQLSSQISTNKNVFNYQDSLFEENIKNPDNDQINVRARSRFSQTTETPVRKSLYSLRIDSESGKFKGQVNNVVLATLETTPNDNTRSEMAPEIKGQIVELTNLEQKTKSGQENETLKKNNNEEDKISYSNENNNSDHVRIRNRGRTFATTTDSKIDEYSRPIAYTTTTDFPDNEPELLSVRARIRTRPKQNKAEYETSSNNYLSAEPQNLTDKQENTPVTRDYNSVTPTDGLYKNRTNTNFSELQSRLNSNLETLNKDYNKRRLLKARNRLSPVFQDQDNGMLKEDAIFDSEEDTSSINNKVTTESDQIINYGFASRGTQNWHAAADEALETEPDDNSNSEYIAKITNERQQNNRQMHINKRIRYTTLPPQTQKYDNIIKSRTVTSNPINDNLNSSTENKLSVPFVDEVYHKVNKETDLPNIVSRSRNWSVTKTKDVDDDDEIVFHREKNYQSQRGDKTHVKSRNNTGLKSSTPILTVDPYTLIRQPASVQEKLPNIRPKLTNSPVPSNLIARNESIDERATVVSQTYSPIAAEINSFFKEVSTSTTSNYTSIADEIDIRSSTTGSPSTTFERIRDKFRLGSFPKPTPSSHNFARKPSVEDSTPPPLPSDRCSQELDNDSECNDKPVLRVRPTSASPDSQATPGLTRGGSRHRGSATYTVSPNEADPPPAPNRGTPSSLSRNRPTLKPSTSIVSKAAEFIDIYRYPPTRPEPIYPTPQVDKTAAKCRKDVCLLPDCSCGGKEIPGDLPVEQTPQIVLLTFDDSVNDLNKGLYSDLFEKGRTNPNGCPIAATFYVSHEWTDYSQVQNLYASGHEMASHSVSHSFGEQFSVKKWTKEIAGQREILAAYGGVKLEDIRGMRAPFLSIGGNKMFKMLYDANFTYDSSMPVYENKPPSWPYTMDYKIFHDCMIPPCPTRSYPGVWEVPMVMWQDLNGGRCSMGDACSNPPTSDGVYKMLIKNFERHFTSNRAPFGLFYHAAWFTQPHHKEGFIAFLDAITKMPEVWVVTNWQAVQWVRDPTPISRLNSFTPFQCNYPERPRRCNNPKVCNLWHKSGVRYMRTCQPCPDIYPWTGKSGVRNSRVDNEIITE